MMTMNDLPRVLSTHYFGRYQLLESRANGADSVLLMVAILGRKQLADLLAFSRNLRMEALVEVHNEDEMRIAIDSGAKLIGISNQNLHTLESDMTTTTRLMKVLQSVRNEAKDICVVGMSGINSIQDAETFLHQNMKCYFIDGTLPDY